jgi:hypothetical protein
MILNLLLLLLVFFLYNYVFRVVSRALIFFVLRKKSPIWTYCTVWKETPNCSTTMLVDRRRCERLLLSLNQSSLCVFVCFFLFLDKVFKHSLFSI